jgi:hypothetical protein
MGWVTAGCFATESGQVGLRISNNLVSLFGYLCAAGLTAKFTNTGKPATHWGPANTTTNLASGPGLEGLERYHIVSGRNIREVATKIGDCIGNRLAGKVQPVMQSI